VWTLVSGEETYVETALMQQRDMLRKELALARVCRADSIPLNKSLVFSSSSIFFSFFFFVAFALVQTFLDCLTNDTGD